MHLFTSSWGPRIVHSFSHSFPKPIKNANYNAKYWLSINDTKKNKMWPVFSKASFWKEPTPVILINGRSQQKYAQSTMRTHRREFPCQPRKTGEDVSDNVTMELIINNNNNKKFKEKYEFTCMRTRWKSRFILRKYKVAGSTAAEGPSERHIQGKQVKAKW